ncbi:hypothetical protein M8C21_021510 [Ambrosia artemisiifolia]|uniref:Receptor-like serine/threonine-protein kinase n=1 Tax=Ambrosia artemisiifolia TaxID=4212 RepID=A0AAD5D7T3_AMBAR|nr:hypothetical protein M8C21_021510 [Ambrosia artemisiifolia]
MGYPQVVWSANRDHPVSDGAILTLTSTGGLVLQDVDGSTVWTTNTTGKSVAGLNLTDDGNLVLFDINSFVVWQSFDYPTDCLLLGQRLSQGQQLIPSVSSTDWTAQKGLFSLQVTDKGLFAYVGSNPPQAYYSYAVSGNDTNKGKRYVTFLNGSLSLFTLTAEPSNPDGVITIPQASTTQYIKLMPDGHLKLFEWQAGSWLVVADPFNSYLEGCKNPLACGRNALCLGNQRDQPCKCLPGDFIAVDYQKPHLGCTEITPLKCNATQDQTWYPIQNVAYFNIIADMENVDIETCKQACVNNCSCKAAIFRYGLDASYGDCYLPYELFTMMTFPYVIHRNASAFIKVRIPSLSPYSKLSLAGIILISTIVSVVFLLGVIGFLIYLICKRRRATLMEEEPIGELPGMPNRFYYEELKTATDNFNKKLGEGGFGAVYEGTLEDGSKIAVKCLEGLGQVNKSFLAEVQSIGSIHHVNLVRLRGFCAWKSQRFLVYEFMSNGSLDQWIYHRDQEHILEWECRKKIILDVAKGLAYLHEDWMLLDMVDKYSENMQTHALEVVEMMKVASWCLQYDYTKRPSMSTVVKALEGVIEVESRLDYNFTDPRTQNTIVEQEKDMTPLMGSVLSGPR